MASADPAFEALLRDVAHVSDVPLSGEEETPRDGDLAPGMQVTPNLRLIERLGAGGMGSVWLARHEALDIEVAVKFVARDTAGALRRFAHEAQVAAKLRHRHVVEVFDYGTMADGRPYLVMELLDGETLDARLARAGLLPQKAVRELVDQVAEALAAAHEQGIVHRDIKPSNLFLLRSAPSSQAAEEELSIKVLDFGVARRTRVAEVDRMTGTGVVIGTPGYMSPEQLIDAREADARADLYSLGVVTYEALTGQLPFRAKTVAALGHLLATGSFEPASRLVDGLPASLDGWFARALARQPEDRFASAAEMSNAFAACFDAAESAVGTRSRARIVLAVLGAVALAVAAAWFRPGSAERAASALASQVPSVFEAPSISQPARPEVASSASPPKPSAARSALQRTPAPAGAAASEAAAEPSAAPAAGPVDCDDVDDAFMKDGEGFLTLKPECL